MTQPQTIKIELANTLSLIIQNEEGELLGLDSTVNRRCGTASNPADDILNGIGTGEGGNVALAQVERAKAVNRLFPTVVPKLCGMV